MPQTEILKDRGYEILYMTDDIDEFAIQMLRSFDDKEFKSVSAEDLELEESEEEKEAVLEQEKNSEEAMSFIKETLGEKVSDVRLSNRLKSHPVCLTAKGGLSIEMEKVLNSMPVEEKVQAERILEINASHPIVKKINDLYDQDREKLRSIAGLLYDQALLIEGLSIDDPIAFSNAVCDLIVE